jgi:hypothetical protein
MMKFAQSWAATISGFSGSTCRDKAGRYKLPASGELSAITLAIPPHTVKVYIIAMKYVLLAIFVLFAAQPLQPLQASGCDMHAGQDTGKSQYGSMHDSGMNDLGCYDHDPADNGNNCGAMSHCGACSAGFVAVKPFESVISFNSSSRQFLLATNAPLSRYSTPPFRPPIS